MHVHAGGMATALQADADMRAAAAAAAARAGGDGHSPGNPTQGKELGYRLVVYQLHLGAYYAI